MLTCQQATQLMSSRLDRELPLNAKIGLKFHLMMCKGCRRCDDQFELIHNAGKLWYQKMIHDGHIKPSDATDEKNN